MKKLIALTTIDNVYDPFTQFDDWYINDTTILDHNCCSLLGRFAGVSNNLSDKENENEMEKAIDEIIRTDPLGIYIKVTKEVDD